MKTDDLVLYLDGLLRIREIDDESQNGLQVAHSGRVEKVALAVDASYEAIEEAVRAKANLLLVHHGLFWGKPLLLTGAHYQRIRRMIEADLALYAAHLPLDLHPELGNNAQLGSLLDLPPQRPFGTYHGLQLGFETTLDTPITLGELASRVEARLGGKPILWPFGKAAIRRIGYVSGGAIDLLPEAIEKGLECYLTGEPRHSAYWTAREAKIHVLFAGHYLTERLGVLAVGNHLKEKFDLETVFIDLPTGH